MGALGESLLRWIKEPLVVYFAVGAGIFALTSVGGQGEEEPLVVDKAIQGEIVAQYRERHGRLPDPEERAQAEQEWRRDEALYREGLRRQLDKDDPIIRGRVIARLRDIERRLLPPLAAPQETELRTWLAQHTGDYETPVTYDYEMVELPPETDAPQTELEELLRELGQKAGSPQRMQRAQGEEKIAAAHGPEFAQRLAQLEVGKWILFQSDGRSIFVRVERKRGGLPAWEQLRPRLEADFKEDRVQRLMAEREAHILQKYLAGENE